MSTFEEKIDRLQQALRRPLPGRAAHLAALPPEMDESAFGDGAGYVAAAVLLPLHPDQGRRRIVFPLIRRPPSMVRHAGQISLPGGVQEAGESAEAAALREANEEVGLPPTDVRLLGRLSPVEIPVTRYLVHPVVGWIGETPRWQADRREVESILTADPDRLAAEGPRAGHRRSYAGAIRTFPAYDVEGERVWGATARILAEFLAIWRTL